MTTSPPASEPTSAAATGKPAAAGRGERMKVFISYARADSAFADELEAGLEFDGSFDVSIDRHEIHEGEAWQARLSALIQAADTVVFMLSPASAASPMCAWEVGEAERLSKRILPVLVAAVADAQVPKPLAALHYVRFDGGTSFMTGLSALRRALKTDLGWLREHTRLYDRASEWEAAGRVTNRLLAGEDVARAKAWLDRRPANAPAPTELHHEFIKASELAHAARQSAELKRTKLLERSVSRARAALSGALLLAIVCGALATFAFQQQRHAVTARDELEKKILELESQEKELTEYFTKAGKAIRDNAELRFRSIIARHGLTAYADPRRDQPGATRDASELVKHVSQRAIDEMIHFEVSSKQAYERRYQAPIWPGMVSGVTIGIGYDIAYNSKEETKAAWQGHIPTHQLDRLLAVVDLKGNAVTPEVIAGLADIKVPFDAALAVFKETTLKKYAELTDRAFPGAAKLSPHAFGALVSLVYNRGPSLRGEKRKEMLAVRQLIEVGEAAAVPDQLRAMQWLWERSLKGLHLRREAEAKLFEEGLAEAGAGTAVPPAAQ